jgi:hypothetical protein
MTVFLTAKGQSKTTSREKASRFPAYNQNYLKKPLKN